MNSEFLPEAKEEPQITQIKGFFIRGQKKRGGVWLKLS